MKCIVFCAGKGGVGKSCLAAYTGAALAAGKRRTLLIELGAQPRAMDLILGTQAAPFGALDILAGRCDAGEATLPVDGRQGLFLMPAGTAGGADFSGLERLLRALALEYDYLLADGVDLGVFPVEAGDVFVLAVTPDTLAVRAASDTARRLYAAGAREVRVVINNVPPQIIPIEGVEDFDTLIDRVGAPLLGVVPHSPRLHYCANNGLGLDATSITVKVFDNLATRLAGGKRPLLIR